MLERQIKAIRKSFVGFALAFSCFMGRKNTNTDSNFKSNNTEHLKWFEKQGYHGRIKTTFELPFVQKRYDDIVKTIKYTRHSKKQERLLKLKKMYEEILSDKTFN